MVPPQCVKPVTLTCKFDDTEPTQGRLLPDLYKQKWPKAPRRIYIISYLFNSKCYTSVQTCA